MPGFRINGVGEDTDASPRPFYKHTWEFPMVLGTVPSLRKHLIYAQDASRPSFSFEKELVPGASMRYKFAKEIVWEDVKIAWYDTEGLSDTLKTWRERTWTPKGGIASAANYKADTVLTHMAFDLNSAVTYRLINSWPASVKLSELTYVDSHISLTEVVITYDWSEDRSSK